MRNPTRSTTPTEPFAAMQEDEDGDTLEVDQGQDEGEVDENEGYEGCDGEAGGQENYDYDDGGDDERPAEGNYVDRSKSRRTGTAVSYTKIAYGMDSRPVGLQIKCVT